MSPAPTRIASLASRALAAAWARGALPYPSLDPAALAQAAVRAERHEHFGGEGWREALDRLTASLEGEARLNPLGRALAHGLLVKVLRERLRATALLARHTRIEAIPIRAPIVILGPMRSGTTRLQRMLACDPRLTHTRAFESLSPVPGHAGQAGRWARVALGLAALHRLNPAIGPIHPTTAGAPEEEFGFFNPGLISAQFATQWRVPGYAAWAASADRGEAYRWFRRFVRITAWARGERAPRPRVLKAPEFMDDLAGLLAVFPDARLVCLERDVRQVVASAASLTWQHRRLHSDHADPHETGREVLALTRRRIASAAAVRAARPDVPQIAIPYTALDEDWRATMHRLYEWLGLPLTEAVLRRMARYLACAREHRQHRYTSLQFGLDETASAALPQGA